MSFNCVELPYRTDAAQYYASLADLPWAMWLDSCGMARYDIVTAAPQRTLLLDNVTPIEDTFEMLRDLLGKRVAPIADVPFTGGALGYWSYDLARRTMDLPETAKDREHLPGLAIGIYDWALVLDHKLRKARIVSQRRFPGTAELLSLVLHRLQGKAAVPPDTFRVRGKITSSFTPDSYAAAFQKVQDYLKSGDCYQINLSQRFSARADGNPFGAYVRLRGLNPAPYSAYLKLPHVHIMCNSPERFISVADMKVETRPIKGTRRRSSDLLQDRSLAAELLNHPKDRAENLMIVDLLRNDLGKNCMPGSVRAPKLFDVESFANVHHLVSTVEGHLAEGCDALDVLRGCFPGGSVTGAPKLRAMQIIEQLEPVRRGVYCGAIGYLGFDGNMDTNIAIRTMVYSNDEIRCWAGGGIVADSDEKAEYQETFDKASAMLELLMHYGGEYDGPAQRI